ncbi:hypothetical protein ASPWEDRAFT_593998 [Aspergillus wentii DTO 134E9]|uniref:Uncharacterized protein n=1 Tax=Aspergillus wentii DTO 134E9 TaxID=1073089 RepID=A0A1L9RD16_ASPWE|nr:uncharacterized protein ASPWEDRAFT_593998 [Aspergillus wentii DTO 134E9]OJJ32816.1 hypothetical protein ASPWEDRAFT_593998 [Aspergillus wentii DTO 134E9]
MEPHPPHASTNAGIPSRRGTASPSALSVERAGTPARTNATTRADQSCSLQIGCA